MPHWLVLAKLKAVGIFQFYLGVGVVFSNFQIKGTGFADKLVTLGACVG